MNTEKQAREARTNLPLNGITIVITRAIAQSAGMTEALEAMGARVIHCPTIEVAPPDSWTPLDAAIQKLTEYDWVVFTSANGVEFFFERLRENGSDDLAALKNFNICAIGPATARALEAAGATAAVVASDSKAEGALAAIIDYVGGEKHLCGLSFLIPRARLARDILPDGLRRMGALVDAVEAYQTIKPKVEHDSVARLFKENKIDAITFTSSSTVSNLVALVEPEDLSCLLAGTTAFCIGPVTAETAERYRISNIVHPQEYNSNALVAAIVKSFARHENEL